MEWSEGCQSLIRNLTRLAIKYQQIMTSVYTTAICNSFFNDPCQSRNLCCLEGQDPNMHVVTTTEKLHWKSLTTWCGNLSMHLHCWMKLLKLATKLNCERIYMAGTVTNHITVITSLLREIRKSNTCWAFWRCSHLLMLIYCIWNHKWQLNCIIGTTLLCIGQQNRLYFPSNSDHSL